MKPMVDLLITGATVVTQNEDREVIDDGAIAIGGDEIVGVGPAAEVTDRYGADRRIEADGHLAMPGLVDVHVHVSDILLRGTCRDDRRLYDWLVNVKQPGIHAMDVEDHELAAALYCREALESGVTTFVENDAEASVGDTETVATKMDVYERAGLRSVYGRGVRDLPPDGEYRSLIDRIAAREPVVEHPDPELYSAPIDDWLSELDDLYERYHGSANGRQSVWVAPVVVEAMSDAGLGETYRFARERDVMTTIHTAEDPMQASGTLSPIEQLRNAGSLGEHALLGHCVQIDERDVRILAETDTRVAHNIGSNTALGNGFAPVPQMRAHGVTLGLSTDNSILSDTVNPLADLRLAVLGHAGHRRDPGVLEPQSAVDMVTIEAARAMRRSDELGSIEAGKKADVALLEWDRPRLTPAPNVVTALVYQAGGLSFDTVVCDGDVVVENGVATHVDAAYPDLLERATEAADRIREASGLAAAEST
jgi:cytosine/adenosine deaminase-related metal-dependent hydrolase